MIIIDGNDGTGKSTLVNSLRKMGYAVSDRGIPSKMTLGEPGNPNPHDAYVILDAPIEVSRARLLKAGKDMNEEWHTVESLTHFRQKFREVASQLGVALYDATQSQGDVLHEVVGRLKLPGRIGVTGSDIKMGIPKGRLREAVLKHLNPLISMVNAVPGEFDRALSWTSYAATDHSPIHNYLLKPRSIPQMVALGMIDIGFCGTDLIHESGYEDRLAWKMFGSETVRLCVLGEASSFMLKQPPKRPLTIASEYPNLASKWASGKGLAHIVVQTYGSTEAYTPTFCDLCLDVVETGATAAANGLSIIEEVCTSGLAMVVRQDSGICHHGLYQRG